MSYGALSAGFPQAEPEPHNASVCLGDGHLCKCFQHSEFPSPNSLYWISTKEQNCLKVRFAATGRSS